MTRNFLFLVGAAYVALAVYCAIKPTETARSVGFELRPGSGQSEYLVVYTGLQFALALIFLRGAWNPDQMSFSLLACLLVHACIVAARTLGFVMFSQIGTTTWILAALEWVILICSAILVRTGTATGTGATMP